MRSRTNCNINSGQVHSWSLGLLVDAKLVKDHGWKWYRRDRAEHHTSRRRPLHFCQCCLPRFGQSAVRPGRDDCFGGRFAQDLACLGTTIERRFDRPVAETHASSGGGMLPSTGTCSPTTDSRCKAATNSTTASPSWVPRSFTPMPRRASWNTAGRYTLVLTWVRRHESLVRVLRRMVARIREIGLKIRRVLLDRAFFNGAVIAFLQEEQLPFVMPVVIRGRAPKKGTKPTGLRWIKRQPAGWYPHAMKYEKQPLKISVCVGYRRHRNRKDGKQRHQKLLFAAWRVHGSPTEIRELYRTAIRDRDQLPSDATGANLHLHAESSAAAVLPGRRVDSTEPLGLDSSRLPCRTARADTMTLHLELLRFKRMLEWIVRGNRGPIPRRLNTLRRSTAVNQTWNY